MKLERVLAAMAVGLGLVGLAGCGGSEDITTPGARDGQAPSKDGTSASVSSTGDAGSSGPVAATVEIQEFKFSMGEIEVPRGSAVRWVNRDAFLHTVTSGDVTGTANVPDGRFDERLPTAGAEAVVTFAEPGRHTYYCRQHNSMNAGVTVR